VVVALRADLEVLIDFLAIDDFFTVVALYPEAFRYLDFLRRASAVVFRSFKLYLSLQTLK
jgi:hypothetical protein